MQKLIAAFSVLIPILLLSTSAQAKWVSFDELAPSKRVEVEVRVLESNDSRTVIELTIPGMKVEKVTIEGKVYQVLTIPGGGILTDVGKPQIPVVARLVAIPGDKQVRVNVLEAKYETLLGYNVYPAQPLLPDKIGAKQPEFVIDEEFYSKDIFYPREIAEVGTPMIWRDYRVVNLICNPVRFNPVKGELKICKKMKVELEYSGFSDVNILKRSPQPTRDFDKLYSKFIINYEFVKPDRLFPSTGKYVIITHDNFYDAILPLANWKHKKGIQTTIKRLSEIPPGDSAAIHNFIINAYNTWTPMPEYVLLVGDTDFLPTCHFKSWIWLSAYNCYYWQLYGLIPNDHTYSLVAGDDFLSDVFIGRIPANSAVECSVMVNKIVGYEEDPYLTITTWYNKATGVGAEEEGKIFTETCMTIRGILLAHGYTQVDTLYERSNMATPANITASLNDGRSFLTFRGHGSGDGWWGGAPNYIEIYRTWHAEALNNGRMLPTVIAPTCSTNCYEYLPKCLGEAFFNQDQGAVGYFGATNVSFSFYNDSLAIGICRGIFAQDIYNFQVACDFGKLFMLNYFPLPDDVTETEFYLMNILGDPELNMWTGVPQNLTVAYPETLLLNSSSFTVSVFSNGNPVEDALVCIMKDTTVYETGETNASGEVTLPVLLQDEGRMYVTVTAHNFLPYEDSVLVLGHLQCSANPPAMYAGSNATSIISAVVKDPDNHTVTEPTFMVTFSIISGSSFGHLEGTNPVQTVDGVATITFRADTIPGIVEITATAGGLKPDTVSVYVIGDTSTIVVSDPIMLDTSSTSYQANPKVAFDGTNYLAVWQDLRSEWRIYGIRLSPTGKVLDTSAILIGLDSGNHLVDPDIVYGGAAYLVMWRRGDYVTFYTRVSPVGTVLDFPPYRTPVPSYDGYPYPCLSYCGDTYISITRKQESLRDYFYTTVIDESGDGNYVQTITLPSHAYSSNIAFNGNHYQFVWYDIRYGSWDIFTARIDISGHFLDDGIPIDTSAGEQLYPAVASDGDGFLVVWEDRSDINDYNIYGARINADGEVLDDPPIVISEAPNHQQAPSIAFDGTCYWVVWVDGRDGNSYNIYGARVTPSGVVLDQTGVLLVNRTSACLTPHITAGSDNQLVVVYRSYEPPPYDNYRIFASIIGTETAILKLTDASGTPGDSSSWSTAILNAPEPVATLQFTVRFDSLLSVDSVALDNQFYYMELAYNTFPESVKVLVYSPSGNAIQPQNEPFVYFFYNVSTSASIGDTIPLTLANVVLADTNANASVVVLRNAHFFVVSKGDINFDSVVDALDLQRCINIILGRPPSPTPAELWAADVAPPPNGDSSVDVLDVIGIVNIILGEPEFTKITYRANPKPDLGAILAVGNGSGVPGSINNPVEIKLNNDLSVAGIQFALSFDYNLLEADSVALSTRASNMTLVYNTWSDSVKVLIYSPSGDSILPDTGSIATVFFSVADSAVIGDSTLLHIKDIVIGDPNAYPIPCIGEDGVFYFVSGTSVENQPINPIPSVYIVQQNYPNPFAGTTQIRYGLPEATKVSITIYNLLGQKVLTLINERKKAGYHTIRWNGINDKGQKVSQGVYFYCFETPKFKCVKKLILLK